MAKVTKSVLKGIVKECLVEILSEGLSAEDYSQSGPPRKMSGIDKKLKRGKRSSPRPALENISFNKAIDDATSVMTNDPVMSAIFADTAKTTLQEQYGAESKNPMAASTAMAQRSGDEAARAVANNPIEDLFEGAGNWANLAFAEKKPR